MSDQNIKLKISSLFNEIRALNLRVNNLENNILKAEGTPCRISLIENGTTELNDAIHTGLTITFGYVNGIYFLSIELETTSGLDTHTLENCIMVSNLTGIFTRYPIPNGYKLAFTGVSISVSDDDEVIPATCSFIPSYSSTKYTVDSVPINALKIVPLSGSFTPSADARYGINKFQMVLITTKATQ